MPYFAVDDGLYDHPKFDGITDASLALWTRAGSWCMRYLTDGFVPSDRVRKLGYDTPQSDELVRRGIWHGVQGGFRFHEWLKHQDSKADIEKHRDRWREEKRSKRRLKTHGKQEMSGSDSDAESGVDSTCPNPTQPNPTNSYDSSTKSLPLDQRKEIAALEQRYQRSVIADARAACALSRRGGKISDSVWLTTLKALAVSPADVVERSVRTFVERHADGSKDERYLLGIVRGELRPSKPIYAAPGQRNGRTAPAPGTTAADFADADDIETQIARKRAGT